ncbi:MAG TPA: DNA-processing protein DprA [Candidatus Saccharimonadales bacterium]
MNKGTLATIQSKAVDIPNVLQQIPDPPERLFLKNSGNNWLECLLAPMVAIVGSRKFSAYGRQVTERLATELAKAGIVIVSGLAMGIDSIAHKAALEVGGRTVAVLAGGLDNIYPAINQQLAGRIVQQGGALLSEYEDGMPALPYQFIARNRLISGLSRAVIVSEAAVKSGSLHTANFALEQGREVLAVPGNITSSGSGGTNSLIKIGATPITDIRDVFDVLGIRKPEQKVVTRGSTPQEQKILDLLRSGQSDGTMLLSASGLQISQYNQTITMLEITGKIRALGNNQWGIT